VVTRATFRDVLVAAAGGMLDALYREWMTVHDQDERIEGEAQARVEQVLGRALSVGEVRSLRVISFCHGDIDGIGSLWMLPGVSSILPDRAAALATLGLSAEDVP
jgi:hypothetical protein